MASVRSTSINSTSSKVGRFSSTAEEGENGTKTPTTSDHVKGMSIFGAMLFIIGELAGGGILALPDAIKNTGWIGVLILITLGVNAGFSGTCLARCWLILEERYEEYRVSVRKPFDAIGYRAVGNRMKNLVSVSMNVTLFGGSVVYLLVCSQLVQAITHKAFESLTFCDWIPIIALIITPITWFGSPADFWPIALGAVLGTFTGCLMLLVNIGMDTGEYFPKATYPTPEFASFFLAFGRIVFSYGGACAFPTFQNDMKHKEQFPMAVVIAFIGLLLMYIPISMGGYLVYGDKVGSNILQNVSSGGLLIATQSVFSIHFFCAFFILINPVAQELEEIFKVPNRFCLKRVLLRTALMIGVVFIAETIPKFGKILNLIGGSTTTLMTFIMPPLFYIRLCGQKSPDWPERYIPLHVKVYLIEIAVVGMLGGLTATYFDISDLIDPSSFTVPCYVNRNQTG